MLQGSRREARERALELLYEAEAKGQAPSQVLLDLPIDPDPFAVDLVTGVGERLVEIDAHLERLAKDWTVERMPWVDRSILRLAAFELLARPDVPTGAVLSEAVELAKRFSTDEAGRFVNGVLSTLAREVRTDGAGGKVSEASPAAPAMADNEEEPGGDTARHG